MNYLVLITELTADPLARGYSGMNDAEAAADLNAAYRPTNRTSMTGSEVLNATDKAEYAALPDADRTLYWNLLHLGQLNPFGREAELLVDIFGTPSATITNLQNARASLVTRAQELGLGRVREGDVQRARDPARQKRKLAAVTRERELEAERIKAKAEEGS